MFGQAEYIWLDGDQPTQQLRSKTRIVTPDDGQVDLSSFPMWSFDGSSTYQADGGDSDCTLQPVAFVRDPIRGDGNYLVLCEVMHADGTPHESNTRARLREVLDAGAAEEEPWVGFEQEYTIFCNERPLGFPERGYPAPQGPFYCGVGSERVYGREFVEAHTKACIDAGLMIYGINAEVMPGQWEFQIGYRDVDGESADPLTVSDHLVIARWLLSRLGEQFGFDPRLDPKPALGDWNGAGAHTNFSTRSMRKAGSGIGSIRQAIGRLADNHDGHIAHYGHGLENRLTGSHETCAIDQFRGGVADRGASIRIPRHVEARGFGYLEDRRPGANCDPYLVCAMLLDTICNDDVGQTELAKAG
ncbi:MAG: glutamine synthetase beta-grasp domain-containing protein [Planctomycetota bacterium]|jgi:glutamine synthetase